MKEMERFVCCYLEVLGSYYMGKWRKESVFQEWRQGEAHIIRERRDGNGKEAVRDTPNVSPLKNSQKPGGEYGVIEFVRWNVVSTAG